ncbi:hypothetical protein MMC07_003514 [Pseudocyphellaria aurata]|nr:hypothetical protein [Pseudocyphellaria aurata]
MPADREAVAPIKQKPSGKVLAAAAAESTAEASEVDLKSLVTTFILAGSDRERSAIDLWPSPRSKEDVEGFLWLTPFLRSFIPGRAEHALIMKSAYLAEEPVELATEGRKSSFQHIKRAVTENVMTGADPDIQYHLATDAGGVLFQLQGQPTGTEAVDANKSQDLGHKERWVNKEPTARLGLDRRYDGYLGYIADAAARFPIEEADELVGKLALRRIRRDRPGHAGVCHTACVDWLELSTISDPAQLADARAIPALSDDEKTKYILEATPHGNMRVDLVKFHNSNREDNEYRPKEDNTRVSDDELSKFDNGRMMRQSCAPSAWHSQRRLCPGQR